MARLVNQRIEETDIEKIEISAKEKINRIIQEYNQIKQ